jgi:HemK-like putative methylase
MTIVRFYGLELATAPGAVMTPRPATEGLVEAALEAIGDRPAVVADVGTGSGAIAVAVAAAAPNARVWATDTSANAVALARDNVLRHGLSDRITILQGQLLEPVPGPVDVVVANLPYLPAADALLYPDLESEPPEAVFAEGDGLDPYRRLLSQSARRLPPDGTLVLQLHRRTLVARREELASLSALISPTSETEGRGHTCPPSIGCGQSQAAPGTHRRTRVRPRADGGRRGRQDGSDQRDPRAARPRAGRV